MEVEKAMKMLTEDCKSAINEFQKHVTKMEHAYDDLEQCGCHLCVCVKYEPAENDKIAEEVLEKVENTLKEACPNLSGNFINLAYRIWKTINVAKPISSIKDGSIGTGTNYKG